MGVSTVIATFLLLVPTISITESTRSGYYYSTNNNLSTCEAYQGSICSKYMKNGTIYVERSKPQRVLEAKLKTGFLFYRKFISEKCLAYAYPAMCLYAFPPCDETAARPKRHQFCRNECEAIQNHICAEEFARQSRLQSIAPTCSTLPPTDSPENKKCIHLSVPIPKPIFKLRLKNVTANIGETVILKCKLKPSKVIPVITWYKDGKRIQAADPIYKIHLFRHNSRMKIHRLKIKDQGRYKCEVTNVVWTVSSESWITANVTGYNKNASYPRCGFLKKNSICSRYLKDQPVYFESAEMEYDTEYSIARAVRKFHGTTRCSIFAATAMCYHAFPTCANGAKKQSLCQEDCLEIKKGTCHQIVPSTFPRCSSLPKKKSKQGKTCKVFNYDNNKATSYPRCGILKRNSFCSRYLRNETVNFHNGSVEYRMQYRIARAVGGLHGSLLCSTLVATALCYHTFPTCGKGAVKERLCEEDCRKIMYDVCYGNVPAMFPECSQLPKNGNKQGEVCRVFNYETEKPSFKVKLSNITGNIGKTVNLMCKISDTTSIRKMTVTWYKDGHLISRGPSYRINPFRFGSRMRIKLSSGDFGMYRCEIRGQGWSLRSEGWIKPGYNRNATLNRCGFLQPTSICSGYLKNKLVYFHDAQEQMRQEKNILVEVKKSHGSTRCSNYAISAMCSHLFPACVNDVMEQRLCKEDCRHVKKICQKIVPGTFPQCSHLPKATEEKGNYCEKPKSRPPTINRCGKYEGKNFCEKYLRNQTIYFYDAGQQYAMERQVSLYLTTGIISPDCSALGIPAICYHLFPTCDRGIRRSKLCKEECVYLKTRVCAAEINMIDQMSPSYSSNMFPDCAMMPSSKSEEGRFCKSILAHREVIDVLHDPKNVDTDDVDTNDTCYNGTGVDYRGVHNVSTRGNACIAWRIPRPNSAWAHNYCRNPKEEGLQPWCYVDTRKKEYCAIERCDAISKANIESDGESTSLGRTIYVVIAIVAVILLGCITVVVYWKVQNSKENTDVSPAGSAVPFAKSSSIHLGDDKENHEIKSVVMSEIMSRGKVKCINQMWDGDFCKVFKGVLVNDQGSSNMNIVIKALNNDADEDGKDMFTKETNLLCHLQHINILGLLGISPTQDFVVFEYLSDVNLHEYVISQSDVAPGDHVLLSIATQIANGMKYLAQFNYVHGDLAARNCFVSPSGSSVKISMLGMGRYVYPSDYDCLGQEHVVFPVRWMAPESIESLSLSAKNDIWAFGVTLWEIFSHGHRPYLQYDNREAASKICSYELLEFSRDCSDCVKQLSKQCWARSASTRPNFDYIHEYLSSESTNFTNSISEVTV